MHLCHNPAWKKQLTFDINNGSNFLLYFRPCFDSCVELLEQCLLYLLSGHQSQQVIVGNSAKDITTVDDNNTERWDSDYQNLDVNKYWSIVHIYPCIHICKFSF